MRNFAYSAFGPQGLTSFTWAHGCSVRVASKSDLGKFIGIHVSLVKLSMQFEIQLVFMSASSGLGL